MAMTDRNPSARILVAGCGKLGGDIALALTGAGQVYGLRRNPDKVPAGITGIGADLTRPETLQGKLPDNLDIVIYCLTPSSYDDEGYHNAYVASSTSVYAQDDDSWVDETSPAEPDRFTGQHILQGEQTALNSIHPATWKAG